MKEQAGDRSGHDTAVSDVRTGAFEVADLVVPPQQRMAMPVQRLEPVTLRRLLGEPGSIVPLRVAAAPVAAPPVTSDDL